MVSRLIYFTLPAFCLAWMLSSQESVDGQQYSSNAVNKYAKLSLVASIIAIGTTLIFGFLSDRISFDLQIIAAYGIRLSAALACFLLKDLNGPLMKFVIGVFIIATHAERVVSDSFLAKRIPGDVRSSFRGVVNSLALLFTFGFHFAAWKIMEYGFSAQFPLIIVAALDGLVVMSTILISVADFHPKVTRFEVKVK
jgi:MFS family permease